MVRQRTLVLLLPLLFALTTFASARDRGWHELYRGELNGRQVLLQVRVQTSGLVSGNIFLPNSAGWIGLSGTALGTSSLRLTQLLRRSEDRILAALDLTLDRRRWKIRALLSGPDSSDRVPIEFRRIASYVDAPVRWGRSVVSATYPVFGNLPDRAESRLNGLVGSFLREKAREYGVEEGERYEGRELSADLTLSISWIDSTLASLFCSIGAQTGAPHLNYWVESLNVAIEKGRPRRLRLDDLIRTDTATLRRIAATCRARGRSFDDEEINDADSSGEQEEAPSENALAKADASDEEGSPFDPSRLKTFVLTRDGIEFVWMEWQLEPPHQCDIPYSMLAPVIRPDGPLGRYLRER